MSEQFNLTWHTFQTHTEELMSQLYRTSSYSDVTLVSDERTQFKAHKFVLNACSTVFKSILVENVTTPFIFLKGVAKEDVDSLLQFMYLGEAAVHQGNNARSFPQDFN